MLKKHPKHQCRSMLTALYLSPTIRPDYTRKPYHRTLPLYQTAPKNHTTVPHHTTKPYHCSTPYPKAVPQNFISWYPFLGADLSPCHLLPFWFWWWYFLNLNKNQKHKIWRSTFSTNSGWWFFYLWFLE